MEILEMEKHYTLLKGKIDWINNKIKMLELGRVAVNAQELASYRTHRKLYQRLLKRVYGSNFSQLDVNTLRTD